MISRISELIRLRQYSELELEIDSLIRTAGWDQVIRSLTEIWDSAKTPWIRTPYVSYHDLFMQSARDKYQGNNRRLPKGKIRDGILWLLDLKAVPGIDIDLLHEFANLNGSSLASVREESHEIGKALLHSQIKRSDTFYLDVQTMASSPFHDLVDEVIRTRSDELLRLDEKTKLKDIVSTYYGFLIAIEGTIDTEQGSLSKETVSAIESLAKSFGSSIKIEGSRLEKTPSLFPHCSEEKAELLANVLFLGIGAKRTTTEAVRLLMETCDSRPLDLLIRKLNAPTKKQDKSQIIGLLAAIGHPAAFETLRDISQMEHALAAEALLAIGYIRHSESLPYLIEYINGLLEADKKWSSGRLNRAQAVLLSLSRTENERVLSILEKALFHTKEDISLAALAGLTTFGEEGDSIILGNMDRVVEMISKLKYPHAAVDILLAVPSILEIPRFSESIADRIRTQPDFAYRILKAFNHYTSIEIPPSVLEAYIEVLGKQYNFVPLIIELNKHPLNKKFLQYPRLGQVVKVRMNEERVHDISIYDFIVLVTIPELRTDRRTLDMIADSLELWSHDGTRLLELIWKNYPDVLEDPKVHRVVEGVWSSYLELLEKRRTRE